MAPSNGFAMYDREARIFRVCKVSLLWQAEWSKFHKHLEGVLLDKDFSSGAA